MLDDLQHIVGDFRQSLECIAVPATNMFFTFVTSYQELTEGYFAFWGESSGTQLEPSKGERSRSKPARNQHRISAAFMIWASRRRPDEEVN